MPGLAAAQPYFWVGNGFCILPGMLVNTVPVMR